MIPGQGFDVQHFFRPKAKPSGIMLRFYIMGPRSDKIWSKVLMFSTFFREEKAATPKKYVIFLLLIFAVFIAGREGSYARTAEEKGKIPAVFLGCQCGHGTGGQRHCKGKQGGNDACR